MESWTKTAVVTGAASGLGRASAEALSRLGWTVVATGLEPAMRVTQREQKLATWRRAVRMLIDFHRSSTI